MSFFFFLNLSFSPNVFPEVLYFRASLIIILLIQINSQFNSSMVLMVLLAFQLFSCLVIHIKIIFLLR
jgi:hypothetical protein